jgi:hypothetical protein
MLHVQQTTTRAAIRFLPLVVACRAWALFNRQAMAWAEHDMAMRDRLAAPAAGPSRREATAPRLANSSTR